MNLPMASFHILERTNPPELLLKLNNISAWQKNVNLDRKYFKAFMQELSSLFKKLQDAKYAVNEVDWIGTEAEMVI